MRGPSNFEISECGTGAVHRPSAIHSRSLHSTDSNRKLLGCVPEEKEFIMEDLPSDTDSAKFWDKELERQGLFRGMSTLPALHLCGRFIICRILSRLAGVVLPYAPHDASDTFLPRFAPVFGIPSTK